MKLKSLALAVLAAVSAPSFAGIVTFDNIDDLGSAELVLLVTKSTGSYIQDLGISVNSLKAQMNTTGAFSQSVLGEHWNTFNGFSDTAQWALVAVQAIGNGDGPGHMNIWTTVGANQGASKLENVQMVDSTVAMHINFQWANGFSGEENPRWVFKSNEDGYADSTVVNLNGNGYNTTNAIGQATSMIYLQSSSEIQAAMANSFAMNNVHGGAYVANFDGTNVSITAAVPAVPEPSTYAMLMGGLLAVGFVARRRAAK
jgi:hypothetical protein